MASSDTVILLIVDYHAAIGDKTPMPPTLRTPLVLCLNVGCRRTFYRHVVMTSFQFLSPNGVTDFGPVAGAYVYWYTRA